MRRCQMGVEGGGICVEFIEQDLSHPRVIAADVKAMTFRFFGQ